MTAAVLETFAAWSGLAATPQVLADLRAGWTLHPAILDGELCAIAAMSGSEIHFCIAPGWRGRLIARGRAREFLAPLLALHGYLTTRSVDAKQHRFLIRLGFEPTWFDGRFHHYMLTALPFGKV